MIRRRRIFFCHDTATTAIYTLSLHDALPIYDDEPAATGWDDVDEAKADSGELPRERVRRLDRRLGAEDADEDRKSTRLNSSHMSISYAVFCLKKKNKARPIPTT